MAHTKMREHSKKTKQKGKTIVYDGNSIFGAHFGLYEYEDINFDESKDNIKREFEEYYDKEIRKKLKENGCEFVGLEYYSPATYNYANDSLDLKLKVENPAKLAKQIQKYKTKIDEALSKNKSYDGYTATTVSSTDEELEKLKTEGKHYEPDILVLKTLFDFKINQDVINDGLVFEPEEAEEK